MSVTGFNLQRRRMKNAEKEEEKKEELSEEELRELGKEYKIKSYHNMKIKTLKERLTEYGVEYTTKK